MKRKELGSCGADCYQVAVVNDAERPFRVVTCDPRTERRAVGYGWGGGWYPELWWMGRPEESNHRGLAAIRILSLLYAMGES